MASMIGVQHRAAISLVLGWIIKVTLEAITRFDETQTRTHPLMHIKPLKLAASVIILEPLDIRSLVPTCCFRCVTFCFDGTRRVCRLEQR